MNYKQAMRWYKKHPKGGKPQYMGFHTDYIPAKQPTVYAKLTADSADYKDIEEMTVAEACIKHPDAIRFANFGAYTNFRCDGPAKK